MVLCIYYINNKFITIYSHLSTIITCDKYEEIIVFNLNKYKLLLNIDNV